MQRIVGRIVGGLLLTAAMVVASPAAYAFLPAGGFDLFDTLRFRKFPLKEFDTDNDGSVEPNEGLEILIEGGPRGFTPLEIEKVRAGLQVWEDVTTSYASFGNVAVTQDILDLGSATPDFQNSISLQVTEDDITEEGQEPDAVDDVTAGLVGITLTTFTLDETVIPTRGEAVIVPAGTIIDADMVINASLHRNTGNADVVADLTATTVALTGLFLGLSPTPLNNLREIDIVPDEEDEPDGLLESEVLALTGASGEQYRIGATPSLFPAYFFVDDFETGGFLGGWADLAPDDISGVSWLYPQGSQARFFNIEQEARTNVRAGSNLPTLPVSGGHVVAWADADNDPTTGRVPVFSTLTGLYVHPIDEALWGRFNLIGLWKQMEIPGTAGVLFNPTYTLSINPLNGTGLSRQAPGDFLPGNTADFFDSISGTNALTTVIGGTTRGEKEYDVNFQSEVFQENENVTDVSNKDAGTPLIWDYERNTVVSADTHKSLPELLPSEPMFGEPNDVCWLNVISGTGTDTGGGTGTGGGLGTDTGGLGNFLKAAGTISGGGGSSSELLRSGAKALRSFRDNVLLNTAPGTALVQAYYKSAPYFARFLLRYTDAIAPVRQAVLAFYWLLFHPAAAAAGCAALAGLVWAYRRHRRAAVSAAALVGLLALSANAGAQIIYMTNQELIDKADLVVRGTVATANARWSGGGRIYTDHTFTVSDVVKTPPAQTEGEEDDDTAPHVSDGATINFSVIGGRIDTVVMKADPIPSFEVGDSAVLFFIWKNKHWVILSGERGKVQVVNQEGKELAVGAGATSSLGLAEAAKETPGEEVTDDDFGSVLIPIDEYLDYLRGLAAKE